MREEIVFALSQLKDTADEALPEAMAYFDEALK